jgi:hypothetical protein
MLRKWFVLATLVLLVAAGCGSKSDTSTPQGDAASPGATACPTNETRKFAKTRFVLNAGLAAGAFKRYIYTPYRSNAFGSGAPHRTKAIVKAAAAGLFVADQLRRAKNNAKADPALCKTLIGPIDKLTAMVQAAAGKFKQGNADPSAIGSLSGGIEGFRKQASTAGAGFQDKTPSL